MKIKKLLPLLVIPMLLTSCSKPLTVEQLKEYIDTISDEIVYPYYRVVGALDYNNKYIEVDSEFTQDPREGQFIPYARYNPGSYDPNFDVTFENEKDFMSFANTSKSYWSRMPLRIHKSNFYAIYNDGKSDSINSTCAYYQLFHYMKPWSDSPVKNADSAGNMVMEFLKDKDGETSGFVFYALDLHAKITIDNYPEYPDPSNEAHWPMGIDYDIYGPSPMYSNEIDASFNFRFEYNKDGWLTREYIVSTNYNSKESTETQFCCEALYSYLFHA